MHFGRKVNLGLVKTLSREEMCFRNGCKKHSVFLWAFGEAEWCMWIH